MSLCGTDERTNKHLKIELLSQWKLEAEFRNTQIQERQKTDFSCPDSRRESETALYLPLSPSDWLQGPEWLEDMTWPKTKKNSAFFLNFTNLIMSPCWCLWTGPYASWSVCRPQWFYIFDKFWKKVTSFCNFDNFGQFQQFWTISTNFYNFNNFLQFLITFYNFENWDNFWKFWQLKRQGYLLTSKDQTEIELRLLIPALILFVDLQAVAMVFLQH